MIKPIFLTDLDDVMCTGGYLYLLNKFLSSNYKEEDFKNEYYLEEVLNDELERTEIRRYWITENVYNYSHIIDGAYSTLLELSDFFEIYVCSSTHLPKVEPNLLSRIYSQKFEYILENFPFILPQNIIFSCDKGIFNERVFIQLDDKIENLNNSAHNKFLFYSYHNGSLFSDISIYPDIKRCYNWEDVKEFSIERLKTLR